MEVLLTLLLVVAFIGIFAALLAIWLWPVHRWEQILDTMVSPLKFLQSKSMEGSAAASVQVESEERKSI